MQGRVTQDLWTKEGAVAAMIMATKRIPVTAITTLTGWQVLLTPEQRLEWPEQEQQ